MEVQEYLNNKTLGKEEKQLFLFSQKKLSMKKLTILSLMLFFSILINAQTIIEKPYYSASTAQYVEIEKIEL